MTLQSKHSSGRKLASLDWLIAHHRAKYEFRTQIAENFRIETGSVVLDVGCGPGLWAAMLAKNLGTDGKLIGVDLGQDLITYANDVNRDLVAQGRAEFHVGDFARACQEAERADLIVVMNVLGYVDNPTQELTRIWDTMRPGAKLIVRQFDNAATIFSTVDAALQSRIYSSAIEKMLSDDDLATILGRHLPRIAIAVGINDFEIRADTASITAPLSIGARQYLGAKAAWFADLASTIASSNDLQEWQRCLPIDGYGGCFEDESFLFSTLEYQIEAIK